MPVKNNYQIKLYHGNSQARIFNFPFRCFSLDDLVVEYIDVDGNVRELVQNTEYSVRGGLDNSGGMITYPLAPEELPLGPHEAIRISRCTPMSQEIDYPSYQQAIENALDKTAMIVQEAVGSNAIDIANEAVLAALEAVADVAEKVDRDGSNIDRIPFLSALKIGSSGEIDLSDLTLTDGSNADPDAFRSLVGMPEIEANISDVESEVGSQGSSIINIDSRVNILEDNPFINVIRPQTIVKGAVGDIPAGWKEDWCNRPAKHLEMTTAGSAVLIVNAGLQVCAGSSGTALLSKELATDIQLDISELDDGTHYVYATIEESDELSIGTAEFKPIIGGILPKSTTEIVPNLSSNTGDPNWDVLFGTEHVVAAYPPAYRAYCCFSTASYSGVYGWLNDLGVTDDFIGVKCKTGNFTCNQVGIIPDLDSNSCFYNFTIEISNDGSNWSTVKTLFAVSDWVTGVEKIIELDRFVTCTFLRIHGTGFNPDNTTNRYQVKQIQIYLKDDFASSKLIPITMTSDTTPSPFVASASSFYSGRNPFRAFNGTLNSTLETGWQQNNAGDTDPWIAIDLGSPIIVNKYAMYSNDSDASRTPISWELQGSNGNDEWETLDIREVSEPWDTSSVKYFVFYNNTAYRYLRLFHLVSNYPNYTNISELQFYSKTYPTIYNPATHTHYGEDGNVIERVYIGECIVASGVITDIVNYQHGTVVTLPVNYGLAIGVSQKHYLDKPFLGYCRAEVRIYHESQWGIPGAVYNDHGVRAFITNDLYVQSGANSLTFPSNAYAASEFTTAVSSAPAKVTVERSW